MPSPATVFISYPHDDDGFFERLLITLQPLEARKAIKVWSDRQIAPGTKWSPEIEAALTNADAAVLLVNPAFLASPFIRENELPVILERARQGHLRILTVLLRPSSIEHALYKYPDPDTGPYEITLNELQFINSVSKPLIALKTHEQDEVFNRVADELWRLVSPSAAPANRTEPAPGPPPAETAAPIPNGSWTPRQTLRPVHRPIKWYAVAFATVALLTALFLSWIVGSGNHAAGVFSEAIFFSALACILSWLMVAKFWDAQFILSTVRALLLLTVFYVICGSTCAYFPHRDIHSLFVITALIFGVVALIWGGHAKWYWSERQFGDLILELIPVALFAGGGSIGVGHLMGA